MGLQLAQQRPLQVTKVEVGEGQQPPGRPWHPGAAGTGWSWSAQTASSRSWGSQRAGCLWDAKTLLALQPCAALLQVVQRKRKDVLREKEKPRQLPQPAPAPTAQGALGTGAWGAQRGMAEAQPVRVRSGCCGQSPSQSPGQLGPCRGQLMGFADASPPARGHQMRDTQ